MFKRFTYMTQTERRTVLMLFALIIMACALLFMIGSYRSSHKEVADVDSVDFANPYSKDRTSDKQKYYATESKAIHLTYFDPNTADSTLLLALGLQPWQVRSIYKYRAAGGVYTRPEDFARLYGLSVKKYRELRPYIRISPDYQPASTLYASRHGHTPSGSTASEPTTHTSQGSSPNGEVRLGLGEAVTKLRPGQTINLNSADTTQLRTVPGIGPFFAKKIDRYRTQLGGFISKAQLLEIPDFPESALPYLTLTTSQPQKLNINKASSEKLRNHPYITYMMAKQITDYRRMHGDIHDLNDLSLLPLFTAHTIEKLRPYITY